MTTPFSESLTNSSALLNPTQARTTTSYEPRFHSLGEIVVTAAESTLRKSNRMSVSDASEKFVKLNQPGAYSGPYDNDEAPYMVEPMDTLASRSFSGEIFVGPAQCGKTQSLILNWIAYGVAVDPADMILYTPSQAASRDFSVRRVDRMHRHSPDVGGHLLKKRDSDNKFDKHYDTGTILTLSWPSVVEFAGRPVGRIAITDRDRMDDDIDGEGEPFDLASKRTTTFGSFAMTLAESSPSRPVTDLKWIKSSPHEAPPCKGILGLYNRGDRRRWYWPCPHCGSYFEGNFKNLEWDKHASTLEAAETVRMICPNAECGQRIYSDQRKAMNRLGRWVKDGQTLLRDGSLIGMARRTAIASFWLNGVAAAFVTWEKLVQLYSDAASEFDKTGSEEALKKFYNNDLGEPYLPKETENTRLPEVLMNRAEDLGSKEEPVVPRGVRILIATVDVQKNMFVCQVQGVLPGDPFDLVVVDRFNIVKNEQGRLSEHDGQVEWVKPGTYLQDWDLIDKYVLSKTYRLADGSGRHMAIKHTACDSGGKAGVTDNAYEFYRKLVREGKATRFQLVKGEGLYSGPRARISYPDASQSGNKAAARGDIPVLLLNANMLKDNLAHRLDSLVPGSGMIRFPDWLEPWFFNELCAEQRSDKGWFKPKGLRNEAWDLLYYTIGLCVSGVLNIEKLDWNNPPLWAAEWDANPFVLQPSQPAAFAQPERKPYDFAKLAEALA